MKNKCLYCYEIIDDGVNFHKKCSNSFFGTPAPPKIGYSLNQMEELAQKIILQNIAIPGVQPKLSMSLVKSVKEKSDTRLTVEGALNGQYIFKPPNDRFPEMPANEHLTMRIAEAYGIRVVPSSLIRLASGEISYITKRIDRTEDNQKIHMIDMFQITEAFDKYISSMEKVGKAIELYSQNTLLDKILYFELVLFSFLTGNNDMHLKNFSLIDSQFGWILSPAYDLLNVNIIFPEDHEELALTLCGKKKKFKKVHFVELGNQLALTDKQIKGVFKRMTRNYPKAIEWINNSFLSNNLKTAYIEVLEKKYQQIGLR
ncbi:type II toxin-antitoxin system HipA family toxin [Brumimicrobium glaciale]|uniref:Type II toxin-antitoxin system HipA family toxin n=1 Tax=Brumimicrobium glaciale TaxID=200475 RepID=A0A4Q4KJ30_9FLAO|nr:HipA domain-containing protein [Brumimicrobium glaciale]RYM33333.1 type II toxin-antitoxin system HipA family toxin [Brumimicrobium glaciale]